MLLTRADMEDRERFLNARDTLRALLDNSIVPVINENDAVATAEIKVGDKRQSLRTGRDLAGSGLVTSDILGQHIGRSFAMLIRNYNRGRCNRRDF